MRKHGDYTWIRTTGLQKILFWYYANSSLCLGKMARQPFLSLITLVEEAVLLIAESWSTITITHSLSQISRWEVFDLSQRWKIGPVVPLGFTSDPCLKERLSQDSTVSLNTMLPNREPSSVYLGNALCISLAVSKESFVNFCQQGQPG